MMPQRDRLPPQARARQLANRLPQEVLKLQAMLEETRLLLAYVVHKTGIDLTEFEEHQNAGNVNTRSGQQPTSTDPDDQRHETSESPVAERKGDEDEQVQPSDAVTLAPVPEVETPETAQGEGNGAITPPPAQPTTPPTAPLTPPPPPAPTETATAPVAPPTAPPTVAPTE